MVQITIKEPKLPESAELEFIVEEAPLKFDDLLEEMKKEIQAEAEVQPVQSKAMKKLAKKAKYNAKYLEETKTIGKVKAGNNIRIYATY